MEQKILTPEELACRWLITASTLQRWRTKGTGPKFSKNGGRISYNIQDIEKYEEDSKVQTTGRPPSRRKINKS